MKLRKLAAALVSGALALSLAAPALAAEAADARLARVTLAVKGTLDIGDEYTEFYGQPDETPLGTRWSLDWRSDDEELSVTATDEGKILSLYRWDTGASAVPYYSSVGSFGLSFPPMTWAQAREYAQAFLDKVLSDNEKVTFPEEGDESLSADSYNFQGEVELNGLPTPMFVSVRVRLKDGQVTRFWRGDESDYAGTPGQAKSTITGEAARDMLKTTLSLRLEYVLDGEGPEKKAVLRYLPDYTDDFYVDAATGALVNLTELQKQLWQQYKTGSGDMLANGMLMAEAAADEAPAAAPTLSEAELEGVAKLEDVLDREALDGKIRAWRELSLDSYTLGSATYTVNRDTGDVTARVTYAKNTEFGIYRRYVTVDAKTGELLSMSGGNPYRLQQDGVKYISAQTAQEKGEAFLKLLWGSQFAKTELYDAPDPDADTTVWAFTFAQTANSYFFPGNSITVRVDAADGSIMGFSKAFDDEVTFDDATGLISEEAAITSWCATFPVKLAYLEVPVALDLSEEFELLRNAGYRYYNALKPGYVLGLRDGWYSGVDAKTGEVVRGESYVPEKMTYDDLEGHWAKDILEELARYNVGWLGGKAQPDKALTQLDYIILLSGANGYGYNPADNANVDYLYDFAYRQGILTREERQEDKILTRAEMVKMLLNSMGYGDVAQLPNIFRCDFNDANQIPEADLGYAALAQGLGIIEGDNQGNYAPTRTAVRSEAAMMLWKYMKR